METLSQKHCLSKSYHSNHFDTRFLTMSLTHKYNFRTEKNRPQKKLCNICVGGFEKFTVLLVYSLHLILTIKYSHNTTTTQPFKRPSTGRLETTILESIKYTTRPDSTALCTCYDDLTPIILR